MQEYDIKVTIEAIYDVVDIAQYIARDFSLESAYRFRDEMAEQYRKIAYSPKSFMRTQIYYREYIIFRKVYAPSLIFYYVDEKEKTVHILRVLRSERDWEKILKSKDRYTYPDDEN